jgi:protein-tyrosine phosphatase
MELFKIFKIPTKLEGQIFVFPAPFADKVENYALQYLQEASIQCVVNLISNEEWLAFHGAKQQNLYEKNAIDYIHYPVQDYGVPQEYNSFNELVKELHGYLLKGGNIGIHCIGGIGRSGLLTAALLYRQGFDLNTLFDYMSAYRGRKMPDTAQQISWFRQYVHTMNSH